jgi:hypothetical protein
MNFISSVLKTLAHHVALGRGAYDELAEFIDAQ